jgi:hypothetical protein
MHKANVNDRASVEAAYPQAAFDEDAGRNALADAAVVHGLRIDSGPDAQGWFALARARHHVGELTGFKEAVFLRPEEPHLAAPLLGKDPDGRAEDPAAGPEKRRREYAAFIDRVLETARTAEFTPPIGRDEPRLKGFHGG